MENSDNCIRAANRSFRKIILLLMKGVSMYYSSDDECGKKSKFPPDTPLAMTYVPWQSFGETYSENTALERGTIFPELYFPFTGKEVAKNGCR